MNRNVIKQVLTCHFRLSNRVKTKILLLQIFQEISFHWDINHGCVQANRRVNVMAESGSVSGPVLHVVVIGFHHKKGCQVNHKFLYFFYHGIAELQRNANGIDQL